MDYYRKYIKYKSKYINLKTEKSNTQINQIAGQIDKINIININNNKPNIKMRIDDNINNKYPTIEKTEMEVNAFGYTHSKIIGGCMF